MPGTNKPQTHPHLPQHSHASVRGLSKAAPPTPPPTFAFARAAFWARCSISHLSFSSFAFALAAFSSASAAAAASSSSPPSSSSPSPASSAEEEVSSFGLLRLLLIDGTILGGGGCVDGKVRRSDVGAEEDDGRG